MASLPTPALTGVVQAKKLQRIPAWRFIGPLLKLKNGDVDGFRLLLASRPGSFYVWLPWTRLIVANDPETVEELLVSKHKHYHKDPGYAALKRLMGNGLITNEGKSHLMHRRMMQPAFHKKRIDEYAECMVAQALARSGQWTDGTTMDMNAEMSAVTLPIIAKTMFDSDVADDIEKVYAAVTTVIGNFERYVNPFIGRIFDLLPIASTRRIHEAERQLNEIIFRMIREHRESEEDRGDLLSMLMLAQGDDGNAMSDQQIRDEAITLFLAGHETTSLALTWTWYLLSKYPDVQARLHEELDAVLPGGRPATSDDVPRLEYTRRVISESMRLLPPVPAFGRQAICDNQLGPYAIRKGEIVTVLPWSMHLCEEYFPNPDIFDPDRWLPERSAQVPKFAYFPFGGGVRKCIGEPFAWMEAILLLATMAQRWTFELSPSARIAFDPKITLRPKHGMPMIARRRA